MGAAGPRDLKTTATDNKDLKMVKNQFFTMVLCILKKTIEKNWFLAVFLKNH